MADKLILHLDMDSFFASVEQAINPSLNNKPIGVGTQNKRAVLSAVSYEAKRFGVKAGMPVFKALSLCPDLIVVDGNFGHYSKYSKSFFDFIKSRFTDKLEIRSIDECNVDATSLVKKYNSPMHLISEIQLQVYNKLRLKVSIGAAWNWEIAKIAANLNKPMGLRVVKRSELQSDIWPLPVESITGIGKVSTHYLKTMKIHTIGDLANLKNDKIIVNIFGKNAMYFKNVALGNGTSEISLSYESQKSLSKERTFDDPPSKEYGLKFTHELAKNICSRVNDQDMVFSVIRIAAKNMQKQRFSVQTTLKEKTVNYEDIKKSIDPLFEDIYKMHGPFILISFGVSKLENRLDYLHKNKEQWKENEIGHDISTALNKKFNKRVIMTAKEWSKHKDVHYHDRFLKGEKGE